MTRSKLPATLARLRAHRLSRTRAAGALTAWNGARNRSAVATRWHRGPRWNCRPCRRSCSSGSGSRCCRLCAGLLRTNSGWRSLRRTRRNRLPWSRRGTWRRRWNVLWRSGRRGRCRRRGRSGFRHCWRMWSRSGGLDNRRWHNRRHTWRCRFRRRRRHTCRGTCHGSMSYRRRMRRSRCHRLCGSGCCRTGHRSGRLLRRRLRRFFRCYFGRRFCLCNAVQLAADLFSHFNRDGTRVSLFLGYAKARQKINNRLCLDL